SRAIIARATPAPKPMKKFFLRMDMGNLRGDLTPMLACEMGCCNPLRPVRRPTFIRLTLRIADIGKRCVRHPRVYFLRLLHAVPGPRDRFGRPAARRRPRPRRRSSGARAARAPLL